VIARDSPLRLQSEHHLMVGVDLYLYYEEYEE
jgi:hypothetical protein